MPAVACPNGEDLKAYAWGELSPQQEDWLADHLETCPQCDAAVEEFERQGGSPLSRLRMPVAPDPFQEEPECRQIVQRLLARGVGGEGATASGASLPPCLACPGRFGEYELLEKLGEGGMAAVYKARHPKLAKLAAIKVLSRGFEEDPQRLARFQREMRAVGQLDHAHIVRAMDAGEAEGRHYLVMEYVEGLDLGKIVDRIGPLAVPDACEIARQVAVGLQAADELGLIHRDIKPSNLMLTPEGQVKILDLGLAVFEQERGCGGETTASGQILGTPDYIAPEQINDAHHVDMRADIYSLGCTLYKLLTGQPPFPAPRYRTLAEKMTAHLRDPVPPIRKLLPKAPEKLAALLDRMVAKDRDLRPAKPGPVVDELAPLCRGADLAGLLDLTVKGLPTTVGAAEATKEAQGVQAGAGVNATVYPLASSRLRDAGQGPGMRAERGVRAAAKPPLPSELQSRQGELGGHPVVTAAEIEAEGKKAEFDPYHKWLGIPPDEQPPTHYRLLGLQAFENDPEVIFGAVMRQSAHLKTFQLGEHAALTQKLLNEVSAAKVCLMDPQRKAVYDGKLRKELEAKQAAAAKGKYLPTAQVVIGEPAPPAAEPEMDSNLAALFADIASRPATTGSGAGGEGKAGGKVASSQAPREHVRAKGGNPIAAPHAATGQKQQVKAGGKNLWRRLQLTLPPRFRVPAMVATGVVLAGTLLLGALFTIQTPKGTLVIESDDPSVQVAVKQGGNVVEVVDAKSGWKLMLKSGEYELDSQGSTDRFQLDPNSITVRRGDTVTVKVTVKPPPPPSLHLRHIADQTIEAGKSLMLAVAVENAPAWNGKLQYSLAGQVPPGAKIDRQSGEFSWRPSSDHVAGKCDVRVVVHGTEGLTDQTTFAVMVKRSSPGKWDGEYTITSRWSNLAIHVPEGKTDNGVEIVQWSRNGSQNQLWRFEEVGAARGWFKIINVSSGKALDFDRSKGKHPALIQNAGSDAESQQWQIETARDGFSKLTSRSTGEVIDVPFGSKSNGTQLQLCDDGNRLNQRWKLERVVDEKTPPLVIAPFDAKQAKEHQQAWAKHLGMPVELTNSIGMKFVLIPPGEFEMGSPASLIAAESSRKKHARTLPSEGPLHRVQITKSFWFGMMPVSQEEYLRIMGDNPSNFQGDPKRPVEQVTWDAAVGFCRRLSGSPDEYAKKRSYRLPTEAEWEYACRAGNTGPWYFSAQPDALLEADKDSLGDHAWLRMNSGGRTHPVGQKRPNAWGLCDMYGNVMQWCQDWFGSDYYANSPLGDPAGPLKGSQHVARGSGWGWTSWWDCRSSHRSCPTGDRRGDLGFRIAFGLAEAPPPPPALRLQSIAEQTVAAGKTLTFTAAVEDGAVWKGRLKYSLGGQSLPGGKIDPQSGEFSWTPPAELGAGKHDATIAVRTADGQSDQTSFVIAVTGLPPPGDPRQLIVLRGHTAQVKTVCFCWDGIRVATGSYDNTARFWDATTGEEFARLRGHTNEVRAVCFSPDGRSLATGSKDNTVKLWDTATARERFTLRGHRDAINSIAFSPQGTRFATASWDGTAKIWDATNGQAFLTFRGHTRGVVAVCFSPDGKRLATASRDGTAKIWDAASGQLIVTLSGHTGMIAGACFGPDGKQVATAGWDSTAKIWDAVSGKELFTLRSHTAPVTSVCFSPDGKRLATASDDRTVKIWDAATGKEIVTLRGHTGNVNCVCFSPNGKRLATCADDNTARIWDVENLSSGDGIPPPPPTEKPDPPADEARAKILAQLKEQNRKEYAGKEEFQQLALAAHIIGAARKTADGTAEQFVMLDEAAKIAAGQGDCLLGLLALDDIEKRFNLPADGTPSGPAESRRMALVALAASGAHGSKHSPAAMEMIADAVFREAQRTITAGRYEAYDQWRKTIDDTKWPSSKKSGVSLAQAVAERKEQLDELRNFYRSADTANLKFKADANDPASNYVLGMLHCLVAQNWDKGLAFLAKGGRAAPAKLVEAAARLATSPSDGDAQKQIADAWWTQAKATKKPFMAKLMQKAACYWYEQISPRLKGDEFREVDDRLTAAGEPPVSRTHSHPPFSVPMHGLAGLAAIVPAKISGKGQALSVNGFANIKGGVSIEYDQVPTPAWVWDLEVTMLQPGGSLHIRPIDGGEGLALELKWDETSKFDCRLTHYLPHGRYYPQKPRAYDVNQRLTFRLYYNEGPSRFFENGNLTRKDGVGAHELRLRMSTGKGTALVIHRCQFRPWTRGDSLRTGLGMPPLGNLDLVPAEAALRLHERNWRLAERPTTDNGFVVPTTGTAMQWVPPGSFERPNSDGSQTTKVTVSRGFWMGRYELTQAEWLRVMPANPSRVTGSPFLPVHSMSWADAGTFCALLTQLEAKQRRLPPKSKYVYRLPTEAEWEHACRAGAVKQDFSVDANGLWSKANSGGRMHEVGEGTCNARGLYDMHGNVSELCLDAWQDEPSAVPLRASDPFASPGKGSEFVQRGGSWRDDPGRCTSGSRGRVGGGPGGYHGFRIVLAPAL